jgi:outer membrane biosynthesis protein TonB
LLLVLLASGCAGSAGSQTRDEPERRTPPEVSDQSLRPEVGDETAYRPRVQVSVETEQGARLETKGATKFISRHARRCYRLALQKDRQLEGRVLYEVIITSNGRVAGVEQMSSSAASTRLDRCLTSTLEQLRFDIASDSKAMIRRLYVRLELRRETFDPNQPPIDTQGR